MRVVLINGASHPPETAAVSVYDRGFLYGDSVFETLRTYGGRPFAMGEHLARLERSAERVFITLPVPLAVIGAEIERGLELAANEESVVRVMLTRGVGPLGLDPDAARDPSRVILVEPFTPPPPDAYARGVAGILVRAARPTDSNPAAGAKVANYLTSVLALREARQRDAAEAFIVDARGKVLEGTTSNLFVVREGALVTPPEEAGILAGITRAHVLSAARTLGLRVEIRDVGEDEVLTADEVFLSSTLREVMPVVRMDGRPIGSAAPGPVTAAIHAALRRKIEESRST